MSIPKSETLALIMKHWTEPIPDTGDPYDPEKVGGYMKELPFNVEEFCRENDARLKVLRERDLNYVIASAAEDIKKRGLFGEKD